MIEFSEVTTGLVAPEGPVALADGSVLVVETLAGRVTRVHPDGTHETVSEPGGGPNGLAIGPDGRCYVCNNGGLTAEDIAWLQIDEPETNDRDVPAFAGRIEVIDLETGRTDVLFESVDDEHLVAPNDLVFDSSGGFWFTDFGSLFHRGPQPGWVCYAAPGGNEVHRVIGPLERTNGIGLSPDGLELYVSETMSGRLWAFSVLAPAEVATSTGLGCGGRLVVERPDLSFDSLAVEAGGHVCVASPGDNQIARIDPTDGSVEEIPTPHEFPTNICFGGDDLATAYVTLHGGGGSLLSAPWVGPGLPLAWADQQPLGGPEPR